MRHIDDDGPSAAMQEYLAEAYRIAYSNPEHPYISTSALAKVLGVSDPAVTRMVTRMKKAGYLSHEPYRGIQLTPLGEREALLAIRRHRLVERFLVDVLRFGWDEVHDDADELGAVVSDALVARMEVMSGFPRRCPHGEPIPSAEGVMPRVSDHLLSDAAVDEYVISRVSSHDAERLRYLAQLGLKPGTRFRLVERAPFNGPLTLEFNGQRVVIGHELARGVRVCQEREFELA
jgi:DtxR family Mn-dependent transcriptional regulator